MNTLAVLSALLFLVPAVGALAAGLWITFAAQGSVDRRVRWVRSTLSAAGWGPRLR